MCVKSYEPHGSSASMTTEWLGGGERGYGIPLRTATGPGVLPRNNFKIKGQNGLSLCFMSQVV